MKIILFILLIYPCFLVSQPTWSVYPPNIMYSGQYQAILPTSPKAADSSFTMTQPIYRSDVAAANYFTIAPNVILSLLGYKQSPPSDGNTFVGFDIKVTTSTTTSFSVIHNVYGASIAYMNYMYLALSKSNTDFYLGQYNQSFDTTVVNKTYSIDVLNNNGENYPNYGTNKIQMKGFLSGYKMKQGTANGMNLNFTLSIKDASSFTIQVSINANSILQQIWYYRIGFDRTAIQRKTNNDVFRDFYFENINNTNTVNIYNANFATATEFQYRNYLMGTNKINIPGTVPFGVQFMLYYYFAQSLSKIDIVNPPYIDNPAKADYLYGQTFYHAVKSCATTTPDNYYLITDRKCYSSCPSTGFYTQMTSKTCLPCNVKCKTCNSPYLQNNCLTCDSTLKRQLNDPDSDGIGNCVCRITFYEDSGTGTCKKCSNGCLRCSYSGTTQTCTSCNSTANFLLSNNTCVCSDGYAFDSTSESCLACHASCKTCSVANSNNKCLSCDTNSHFVLSNNICICQSGYELINQVCSLQSSSNIQQLCGDGILTKSQQCDDNNVKNNDGCSSQCKIQPDHVCINDKAIYNYSLCYFNGSLSMTITDVSKSPYENVVGLLIKIQSSANQQFLNQYLTSSPYITLEDISRRLYEEDTIRLLATTTLFIKSRSYDSVNKLLSIEFEYNQNFDIRTKKIRFQPSNSNDSKAKYFFNSPQAIVHLQKTFNKIDTKYYDSTQYDRAKSLRMAFLVLVIAFWIISLIFIIIGKGNVAMEMMIVYQIVYVSLLSQQQLEIMFGGLSEFGKYTAGFNIQFFTIQSKCVNFSAIELSCSLVNNLNITLIVMIFIVLLFWGLKLTNRVLNYLAQKQFVKNRHQKYMKQNNEKTNQNINPNIQNQSRLAYSQSSQAIEQNYYKQTQYIPQKVYNVLLDLSYFFSFVTVMIWVLSMCYIQQDALFNTIQAVLFCVIYICQWIFWFFKYKQSDFSFCQAHKQNQVQYQDQQSSQNQSHNGDPINLDRQVPKKKHTKKIKRRRCQFMVLKVFFYPLIWFSLLGIAVILGLTESVGFVTESISIAGSLLFGIIIWVTKIYKQKLHIIRSILNCLMICSIEILYIVSQIDSLIGPGLSVALIVFILLSVSLICNSLSTFYLYTLQIRLLKKKQQLKSNVNIKKKVQQLKIQVQVQKQKSQFNPYDAQSSNISNNFNQLTIKKQPYHNLHSNAVNQQFKSNDKFNNLNQFKVSRQQLNNILTTNKFKKQQSFGSQPMKREPMFSQFSNEKPYQSRNQLLPNQKKKLFGQSPIPSLSLSPDPRLKSNLPIDQTQIKFKFDQRKY